LGGLLGLIQFARLATLVTVAWTMLFGAALVWWQARTWAAEGYWPSVRISTIIEQLRLSEGATYLPASVDGPARAEPPGFMTVIAEAPVIVAVLVAIALLLTFYLWLGRAARLYGDMQ
jgi:hypothetical protein